MKSHKRSTEHQRVVRKARKSEFANIVHKTNATREEHNLDEGDALDLENIFHELLVHASEEVRISESKDYWQGRKDGIRLCITLINQHDSQVKHVGGY